MEHTIGTILSHVDNSLQYGEAEEPKMPDSMQDDGDFDDDV